MKGCLDQNFATKIEMIKQKNRLMIKVVVLMRMAIVLIWFGISGSAVEGGWAVETHHSIITSELGVDGWDKKIV